MPFEYKHEVQASASCFSESTHSLALRACITDPFAYVISIPEETETRNIKKRMRARPIKHQLNKTTIISMWLNPQSVDFTTSTRSIHINSSCAAARLRVQSSMIYG